MNIAVSHKGELIHQRGYGLANIENDVPFKADTVMRLGSTSKQFCATCILILEQRGSVRFDDDIREYVPELKDYRHIITLRHLLTMTSGLWDGLNVLLFSGLDTSHSITRDQILRLCQKQNALMFKPGDDISYSNTNYALLSLVVERVSGKPLAEFLNNEIFRPLGMNSSALVPFATSVTDNQAKGYVPTAGAGYEEGLMLVELCGDGGINSTLADMLRWLDNYRHDQHFGPDFRQRLEQESRLNDGRLLPYRFGITVNEYRGQTKVSHAGGMPGYLCDFVFLPDMDFGIIMFANVLAPRLLELPDHIIDIAVEKFTEAAPASTIVRTDIEDSDSLHGVFADEDSGLVLEFQSEDGQLVCYLLGERHLLTRAQDGPYKSYRDTIVLELSPVATNKTARPVIELVQGCCDPVRLLSVIDPRSDSGAVPIDPATYMGRYYHAGLQESHLISWSEDALEVSLPGPLRTLVWKKLLPVSENLFIASVEGEPSCTNVTVRFLREGSRIIGLTYNLNRCKDVVFEKINE